MSRAISAIGRDTGIPEQFLGFLSALGADSPEITSSIVAMLAGRQDVGVGIVFGSNLFNIASLLGLAAVLSGKIRVRRGTVIFNGGVCLLVTVLAVLLAANRGPRLLLVGLIVALPVPYAALLWMRRAQVSRLPLPSAWTSFLAAASGESQEHGRQMKESAAEKGKHPQEQMRRTQWSTAHAGWVCGVALVLIIIGSTGLVRTTTRLAVGWLPDALLGPIVLAALTGIPNVYTATRLAMRGRGSAVLTEAMNSNLLNLVIGLAVPALVFGGIRMGASGAVDTIWLLALTAAAIVMAAFRKGLSRSEGGLLIAAYVGFVALRVTGLL